MSRPEWAELAEHQANIALLQHDPMVASHQGPSGDIERSPHYLAAAGSLRWAVWCVESLYELRDLVDLEDARGDALTPMQHRAGPAAMGHVMWTCVTAMGALDRVAAAFGHLHLPARPDGRAFDFAGLYDKRKLLQGCEPVREWLRSVQADPAYSDVLSILRNPMTHRSTSMNYYSSAGEVLPWRDSVPHGEQPEFYIGEGYVRAIGVDELLREVTPSAERHVRSAVAMIVDGTALPSSD